MWFKVVSEFFEAILMIEMVDDRQERCLLILIYRAEDQEECID